MNAASQVICILLATSANAFAGVTVQLYQQHGESDATETVVATYVAGLGDGLMRANSMLEARNVNPLWCAPPGKILGKEDYYRIIDQQIQTLKGSSELVRLKNADIGLLLAEGLVKTFPCDQHLP